MLLRLDNPRLVINAQEFPQHVVLMLLRYGEASGEVLVSYFESGATGPRSETLEPTRRLNIMDGMVLHEFVLPFERLHDRLGRRGATSGFHFIGNSAFRQHTEFGVRVLDFTMLFPAIGGGVIRFSIGGQDWELSNPTFYPLAEIPAINTHYGAGSGNEYSSGPAGIDNLRVPDDVLINAYQRTHAGYTGPGRGEAIERRRQDRLANFNLQEVVPLEGPNALTQVEEHSVPDQLEGGSYREPPRRIPVPPGVIVDPVEQRRQDRLAQIRTAEEKQESQPGILISPARAAKKPPRTRFERDD